MVVAEFGRWNGGLAPRLVGIYQDYKSCGKRNVLESVGGYLDLLNFGDLCDYDLTLLIIFITHDI